jgi:hypothetical protein
MRPEGGPKITLQMKWRVMGTEHDWPPGSHFEHVEAPSGDEVAAAIARLDGHQFNEVELRREEAADDWWETPSEAGLLIGGGVGGRVRVIFIQPGDDHPAFTSRLVERRRGDDLESQSAGAQSVEEPARFWVTKDRAVTAALAYLERGVRDPSLDWEPPAENG